MSDEWLSVKDIADKAGVTQQAIYKRLETTLKPFVKQVGKRKYLNIEALEHIDSTKTNQQLSDIQPTSTTVELLETVNKTIELLQKQLEIKDKQIETKDKQIQSLNDSLDNALKNSSQSNFLLAQEKQKSLDVEEEDEKIIREAEEKKPWYKRMFGR